MASVRVCDRKSDVNTQPIRLQQLCKNTKRIFLNSVENVHGSMCWEEAPEEIGITGSKSFLLQISGYRTMERMNEYYKEM